MTINYSLAGAGIFDYATTSPVVVELYDPAFPSHCWRQKVGTVNGTGSFQWDGRLFTYDYQDHIIDGPWYTQASKAFGKMYVHLLDQVVLPDGSYSMCPTVLQFRSQGLALDIPGTWTTRNGETRLEIEAGVPFLIGWEPIGFTASCFELSIDKAFQPKSSLPYGASDLIHPVGQWLVTEGAPNPIVEAVYETGSRAEVAGTDLGPAMIGVIGFGWDDLGNSVSHAVYVDVTVMRTAELTAYFTPHEANPDYVGPWPDGCYFSPGQVVIAGTGEAIYVDDDFRGAVIIEGYGKIHRLRHRDTDGLQGGEVPPANKQYIGYEVRDGVPTWFFSDKAYSSVGSELTLYSTARNGGLAQRSYYNRNANYTVQDLDTYGREYVRTHGSGPSPPQDPPAGRITDDIGGGLPQWMDIYFDRTDFLFGADPDCVNGFGGSTWDYIDPSAPPEPIKVYK